MNKFIAVTLFTNGTEKEIYLNLDHVELFFSQEDNTVFIMTFPTRKPKERVRYLVREPIGDIYYKIRQLDNLPVAKDALPGGMPHVDSLEVIDKHLNKK